MEPKPLKLDINALRNEGGVRNVSPYFPKVETTCLVKSFRLGLWRPNPVMGLRRPWWGFGLVLRPYEIPQPIRVSVSAIVGGKDQTHEFTILECDAEMLVAIANLRGDGKYSQHFTIADRG